MTLRSPGILKYLEALMFVRGENRASFGWEAQLFSKVRAPWEAGKEGTHWEVHFPVRPAGVPSAGALAGGGPGPRA